MLERPDKKNFLKSHLPCLVFYKVRCCIIYLKFQHSGNSDKTIVSLRPVGLNKAVISKTLKSLLTKMSDRDRWR